jgi:hypothetical protein
MVIAVVKKGNGMASEAARAAARDPVTAPIKINLEVPKELHLTGAKLKNLTQAMAYRGIKELKKNVSRKATNENPELVQAALEIQNARTPTASTIWKSLKHRDVTR